jgi:hypothetical protein
MRAIRLLGGFPGVDAPVCRCSDCSSWRDEDEPIEYRDVMDLVLCSVIPETRPGCMSYYAGQGPPLRDLHSKDELRFMEALLLFALEAAWALYKEGLIASWREMSEVVVDAIEHESVFEAMEKMAA